MLNVNSIEVCYEGIPAVHDVSFRVNKGELVSLVGANGAGKTTILKTIAGNKHPTKGEITFKKENIGQKSTSALVRKGITYVPESRLIFAPLSVEKNLRMGGITLSRDEEVENNLEYVYSLFPRLEERKNQRGGTLSGGEQQMLAIGRGLMSQPELLMLDEPSLGLMPKLVTVVMEAVKKLSEAGNTILFVEQNVNEALELADRGYVLQTGRTVKEGTGGELLQTDLVREAFLGI